MSEIKHFVYPPTGVEHYGEVIDSKEGFDVIECEICGFRHIVPIPTDEELDRYYKTQFYDNDKPYYFEKQREDIEWWNIVYQGRYTLFEKYLPTERRRILDVGSGPGFFLKLGKDRDWKTLGIEPSIQASNYAQAQGLEIVNEFLSETSIERLGKFDVVHMNGVLEHLPDPKNIINICYQLLNPGGLLFICVANEYNPLQQILSDYLGYPHWWLVPPQHINYFSINSIEQLVVSCSFEVLHTTTTFPMEIFLLMGDNYVGNDSLGSICHNRRKNLEFALVKSSNVILKQKLYKALAQLSIGREIELIAMKSL